MCLCVSETNNLGFNNIRALEVTGFVLPVNCLGSGLQKREHRFFRKLRSVGSLIRGIWVECCSECRLRKTRVFMFLVL
jgi:hypothetical protein